ncbi:transforming growth factor beta regulator 1 isoform X2 [Lycorma delicatula]|uniref:transforming growth factor beta regulator 1 isoform X2 n=1 Tax=Lycorma delicatula TaxID=130591 RepID=UPI003F514350
MKMLSFNSDMHRKYFKTDPENEKYKKKHKRMKRTIKDILFENAALCDQVALMQERILIVKEERNFLLKKLQQLQPTAGKKVSEVEHSTINQTSVSDIMSAPNMLSSKKPAPKKRANSDTTDSGKSNVKIKKPPNVKAVNVKRKKIVQQIPLDTTGRPIFPIVLGDITVHSLGEVSDRSEYYTEDYIYPIGYCSTRLYGSLKDPEQRCVYTCKVMDGGMHPRFEIVADTDLDAPIVNQSIDQCHTMLLHQINKCLGSEVISTKGRGADFFGLSHSTVHHLIQSSPGARKCQGYIWTKFEVSRSSDMSGTEENEASLSYSALQRSILFSKSHSEIMIKEEPDVDENFGKA